MEFIMEVKEAQYVKVVWFHISTRYDDHCSYVNDILWYVLRVCIMTLIGILIDSVAMKV